MGQETKGACIALQPLVTIGMPLYNNAATIERAINSIRRQTWPNIDIVISDDGSYDDTFQICRRLADKDNRIKLFRQDQNLYFQNFRFVLEKASADYFMWAAGDDYWRPGYIEANMQVLLERPDVVASVSRCLFVQKGRAWGLANGTFPLLGTLRENIEAFLRNPNDNTRMYGVFRREALLKSFPTKNFHAYDWALSVATLQYGKHFQIDRILMRRDKTPSENYSHSVNRDHSFFLYRYFPVLRMVLHLLFVSKIPLNKGILRAMIKINGIKHQEYVRVTQPVLYKRLEPLYTACQRYILWRL